MSCESVLKGPQYVAFRGKANCVKQLVLEKERDTQMEAAFAGIDFAEICSVKIARPQTAFSKIREIVAKKIGHDV